MNLNVLRLAGLLTETESLKLQGLLVEDDPSAGGAGPPDPAAAGGPPPEGAEGDKPEDPSALLDQAIELLNKIKGSMGGGADKEATPPPQGF
jgi:hypothetical protein